MISLLQIYNDYYNTASMRCPLVKMLIMLAHYKFEWSLSQKVKPNEKKYEVNKATTFSTVNQKFRNTSGTDPGVLIKELSVLWRWELYEVWNLCIEPRELSLIKGGS